MIIEIKNLPDGRKVKHIHVDISFEEDGTPLVKTNSVVTESVKEHKHDVPVNPVNVANNVDPMSEVLDHVKIFQPHPLIPTSMIHTDREQKEVPPEMKDIEF